MVAQFKSLIQVLDHFKSEETCKEYLVQQRWNGKVTCPHCDNEKVYVTNRGYKCTSKECHKKFSVTSGTIMDNTKIEYRLWLAAIYLVTAHKKGISSLQLGRDLNITQKTAWFLLHRIRQMLANNEPELLGGVVEADATFVGGNISKMHKSRRDKLNAMGTGVSAKTGVFGVVERDGSVRTQVINKEDQITIRPLIRSMVEPGTLLVTDGHGAYKGMKEFNHAVLEHEKGEYVRDHFHTGYIDGYWSLLKRGIVGIYHSVSPKHLNKYCNEFSYRYNTRKGNDVARFEDAVTKFAGARLRYVDLVN